MKGIGSSMVKLCRIGVRTAGRWPWAAWLEEGELSGSEVRTLQKQAKQRNLPKAWASWDRTAVRRHLGLAAKATLLVRETENCLKKKSKLFPLYKNASVQKFWWIYVLPVLVPTAPLIPARPGEQQEGAHGKGAQRWYQAAKICTNSLALVQTSH